MDIIWSLGLLVVIFVAFGVMSGGRAPSILRPAIQVVERLLTFAVRGIVRIFGSVFRIGASSIKLPKGPTKENDRGPGPPPPRWKD